MFESPEYEWSPDLPRGAGLVAAIFAYLAWATATGWRREWAARTAVGRVGLLASLPLRLLSAAVFGALAVALWAIAVVEWVLDEAPSRVAAAYRRRAVREGRDD